MSWPCRSRGARAATRSSAVSAALIERTPRNGRSRSGAAARPRPTPAAAACRTVKWRPSSSGRRIRWRIRQGCVPSAGVGHLRRRIPGSCGQVAPVDNIRAQLVSPLRRAPGPVPCPVRGHFGIRPRVRGQFRIPPRRFGCDFDPAWADRPGPGVGRVCGVTSASGCRCGVSFASHSGVWDAISTPPGRVARVAVSATYAGPLRHPAVGAGSLRHPPDGAGSFPHPQAGFPV
ncbi:hypothetical protein RN50_01268 [Microbacterium foliorum]|uniref:Uncharacterized protein n=1 Tax=Microbacterium foliorum TaxID=104336 RepID=A0A0F0KQA3_9MICO|nr:hypothetical protein RN50_01268 [Microbacterium foliorum]